MRNIAAVKQCLLGKNKPWLNCKIDDLQLCKSTFLKILSITVPQMHFLVVYVPVICYAVWSLQMWSEHCLWWSEGPPSPLVRNTKQRVRSNPARCTCRPKNTRHQAQNTDSQKRKFSRKSNKTQIQEAEACALGLTDDFLQRCKWTMWTQRLASFFNATKVPITDYIQTSWTLRFGAYYKKKDSKQRLELCRWRLL